jgi:hypothetical protein
MTLKLNSSDTLSDGQMGLTVFFVFVEVEMIPVKDEGALLECVVV